VIPFDTTSQVNTYRAYIEDGMAKLYINGVFAVEYPAYSPVDWIPYLGYQFTGVTFGDGTTKGSADAYIGGVRIYHQDVAQSTLSPPMQVSPADGAQIAGDTVTLEWTVGGGDTWPLQVERISDSAAVFIGTITGSTQKTLSGLESGSYRWRVGACDGGNCSAWTPWWSFAILAQPKGTIQVTTNLTAASFSLSGPETYQGSGKSWSKTDASPGEYTITFDPVSGWDTPSSDTQTLTDGGSISFTGTYSDTTVPTIPGNLSSDPGKETWSRDNTFTVSWNAGTDGGSGVAGYSFVWDTNSSTEPDNTPDTTQTQVSSQALADGDSHYFHVRTVDKAGNASETVHFGPFLVDTAAPSGGTIIINDGAESTGTAEVSLTLSASDSGSGMGQMRFSNDNSTWSDPVAYASSHSWTLSPGEGLKTVYVQFSDKAGNWTTVSISDGITVVNKPPDPTGLTVDLVGDERVDLKWDQILTPSNVTYRVYRSETENGIFYVVNTQDLGMTDAYKGKVYYTDQGIENNTTYYYKVRSFLGEVPSEHFSNVVSAKPTEKFNFEFRIVDPTSIVNVGGKGKYYVQLLPKEKFGGTLNVSCSGLPEGLSYEFFVNGSSSGSSLSGIVPPASVTLEVTAGSATSEGEHRLKLSVQNVWQGGSSDFWNRDLLLTVVPRSQAGVHVEVEKLVVRKGEKVRIYGSILPPLQGKTVVLTLTDQAGSGQTRNLTTTLGGKFEDPDWISTLGIGTYDIEAAWTDDDSKIHTSLTRSFIVDKGQVALTCVRKTNETPEIEVDFTVLGDTRPEIPYARITLRLFDPDGGVSDHIIYADEKGHYERIEAFFSKNGIWKFKAYWEGNEDYIGCESDFLTVPVGVDFGRAIMLGGGEAEQTNTYWEVTKRLSTEVYRDFRAKGFRDDMVYLMINSKSIDIDYDDVPDPVVDDDSPTVNELVEVLKSQYANELGPETPLFIYLQGHGTSDKRLKVLGSDQYVSALEIKDALDRLQGVGAYEGQGGVDCNVIVILESCYSGNFIEDLTGPNRVVLTSAGNERYNTDSKGRIAFSRYLFSKLREGDSLKKAFDYSRSSLVTMGYPAPRLDDNGDGVADASDGLLAANLYLNGLLTWGLKPEIQDIIVEPVLEEKTSTPVNVKVVKGDLDVARVWVQIIAPDANITGGDQTIAYPEMELAHNTSTGLYEGTLTDLKRSGLYKIVAFAEDIEHEVSDPATAYVSVALPVDPGDVNGDTAVDLDDAILALKILGGVDTGGASIQAGADVNGDNVIGLAEAAYVLQYVAEMRQ